MAGMGTAGRDRHIWRVAGTVAFFGMFAPLPSCSIMPSEFNLSPFYRHRLDDDGNVLEMDVLWPLVHYETLVGGGVDFRIRPFYRRVEQPDTPGFGEATDGPADGTAGGTAEGTAEGTPPMATDIQFLWPLGRVRYHATETHARLFPVFNFDGRHFADGRYDSDWYLLFPFIWGGSDRAAPVDGEENQKCHYSYSNS